MATVLKEFVIRLPLSTEEYKIGQLYTVLAMSRTEGKNEIGLEVLENKDVVHDLYGKVRKTVKIMHLESKLPSIIKAAVPASACIVEETSYNGYTKCVTTYKNKYFGRDKFHVKIDSLYVDESQLLDNPFGLSEDILKEVKREIIDIAAVKNGKYDLTKYKSKKTERGPFTGNWAHENNSIPIMTCYKLVYVEINNFWLGWAAKEIMKKIKGLIVEVQQTICCRMDEWYGMTSKDIEKLEGETVCNQERAV